MRTFFRAAAALILAIAAVGCGGSSHEATVSGTVKLDGQLLRRGDVQFHPVSGKSAPAYGKIKSDGSYTLKTATTRGLEPGEYVAVVVAHGEPPADDVAPPVLTPDIYGRKKESPLKFTITAGHNNAPIEMTTPPGPKRGR